MMTTISKKEFKEFEETIKDMSLRVTNLFSEKDGFDYTNYEFDFHANELYEGGDENLYLEGKVIYDNRDLHHPEIELNLSYYDEDTNKYYDVKVIND